MNKSLALERAEKIVKVRSGMMTATDAARELGVSRKTYYVWEKRALSAMVEALENGDPGRPSIEVDGEKEELKDELEEMRKEKEVADQAEKIREILADGIDADFSKKKR